MTEAARHHKKMEELRQRELDNSEREYLHKQRISELTVQQMELTKQQMEFQFRMTQLEAYKKGTLSASVIKRKYPELVEYLDSDSD